MNQFCLDLDPDGSGDMGANFRTICLLSTNIRSLWVEKAIDRQEQYYAAYAVAPKAIRNWHNGFKKWMQWYSLSVI